ERRAAMIRTFTLLGSMLGFGMMMGCGPPPAPENLPDIEAPTASETQGESAFCKPSPGGDYPADAPTVDTGETEEFVWAEGGGCIQRPIEEVWGVLHNQPLMVWKTIDRFEAQPALASDGALYAYNVHYEVDRLFTVTWDMRWTHILE